MVDLRNNLALILLKLLPQNINNDSLNDSFMTKHCHMRIFAGYLVLGILAGSMTILSGCEKKSDEAEQIIKSDDNDAFSADQIIADYKNQQNTNSYGTFLAARHAYRNKDLPAAVYYLEEGLQYNAKDKESGIPEYLEREYFFTNLYQGNIDTLINQYAGEEKNQEFPVQLIRFTHAVKQENWVAAQTALDQISDRLPWKSLLAEWLSYGRDKTIDKTVKRQAWNSNFNLGLLQLVNGDQTAAYNTFNNITEQQLKAVENSGVKDAAPVHWPVQLLLMQLSSNPGNKQQLLEKYQQYIPNGFAAFLAKKLLSYDEDLATTARPETVQQGLATLYLSMATTLQSANTEVIAILYYQLADYLMQQQKPLLAALNNQLLGYNLENQDFYTQALKSYDNAYQNPVLRPFSVQQKARVLWNQNKKEAAIDLLSDYMDDNQQDVAILQADAADYLRLEHQYSKAIPLYDRLLQEEKNKDSWQLYFARGVAKHQDIGIEWPEAEADLLKAYELAPDQPEVLNYLGYSWVEENKNLEQAEDMILKAIAQRPRDGFMIDSAGWVYYKLGDYEKALRYLKQAVRLEPGDPVINDHYGDALYKVKRYREAGFQWQRSLTLDPEEELAEQLKEKLKKLNQPSARH